MLDFDFIQAVQDFVGKEDKTSEDPEDNKWDEITKYFERNIQFIV